MWPLPSLLIGRGEDDENDPFGFPHFTPGLFKLKYKRAAELLIGRAYRNQLLELRMAFALKLQILYIL